jgi:hypothetical protein
MEWAQFLTPAVLAPGGLVALTVIFIYTGRLVPRWQVQRMEEQADLEIAHLKETVNTLTASTALFAKAAEASTQTAVIVQHVLEALQTGRPTPMGNIVPKIPGDEQ